MLSTRPSKSHSCRHQQGVNQPDKESKVRRSPNGVRRGLGAAKRRERPLTQYELKKVINGESSEVTYRFAPPSGAAGREEQEQVAHEKLEKAAREEEETPATEAIRFLWLLLCLQLSLFTILLFRFSD